MKATRHATTRLFCRSAHRHSHSRPNQIRSFLIALSVVHRSLEEAMGVKLPSDLTTSAARDELDALCVKHGVDCRNPRTTTR